MRLTHRVTTVDASLGGLGGCPFAPGASGNIVTKDLVFLLESMGLRMGMDLPRLLEVREQLQRDLPQEQLYGFVAAAGVPKTYTAAALILIRPWHEGYRSVLA